MSDPTLAALRVGSLGILLTATSILWHSALVTAVLRTREGPVAPLVLYIYAAACAVPVALGAFVHEALLPAGVIRAWSRWPPEHILQPGYDFGSDFE